MSRIKLWPSGHSSDYTIVVRTASAAAAKQYLKNLPKLLKDVPKEAKGDILSSRKYAEDGNVIIYKEFDSMTPENFGALGAPGVTVEKYPEKYPNHVALLKFLAPAGKTADPETAIRLAVLGGASKESAGEALLLLGDRMMIRAEKDGLVFRVCGYLSAWANDFYVGEDIKYDIKLDDPSWKVIRMETDLEDLGL